MNVYLKPYLILGIISLSIFISLFKYDNSKMTDSPASPKDYEKAWKKVDSLDQKGLPKSALEEVVKIYATAKKENNTPQILKAVIHKLKYQLYLEEDGVKNAFAVLNKEIAEAKSPQKQLLHSLAAELYWQYYTQNRYRFYQRSKTTNLENSDINTWDLNRLVKECIFHYQSSLENPEQLKETDIRFIDLILHKGTENKYLRPTLYDFLAHRAVDFFSNEEPQLIRPSNQFTLNDNFYLKPAPNFIKERIETYDSLAFKFYAINILQGLIKFHIEDKQPDAFIDTELKRLSFVRNSSANPLKDSVYLQTLQQLQQKYKDDAASAEITYYMAKTFFERGSKYNPKESEDFKWDLKKAYTLCNEAIKEGQDGHGLSLCESLQSQILSKDIGLTMEEANAADKPFLALVKYKNVNKLYFSVYRSSKDDLEKIDKSERNQRSPYHQYGYFLVEFYKKQSPVQQFEVELPDDVDYQDHSVEVKIPGLPLGEYVVFASTNKQLAMEGNAVAYGFTVSSNISYINRNNRDGGVELFVMDRTSGGPLENATVKVFYQDYNQRKSDYEYLLGGTYTADREGFVNIPSNGKSFYLEITNGKDVFHTTKSGSIYKEPMFYSNGRQPEVVDTQQKTFYFTDRAIYRPGQTIHFKGILINPGENNQHQIVKNRGVSVYLNDVNGQKVAELKLMTNEYGTFSGTFTAPNAGLNGQMQILDNYGGNYSFLVEDYKRPKFEVILEEAKELYRLGDSVNIAASAKAFAGNSIDRAEVKYRVVRKAIIPLWWCYRKGFFPETPATEILNGTTQTNEKGEFKIYFSAIPDLSVSKESKPTYNFTIYADVTDINGETRSSEKTISIGYTALSLGIDVPEKLFKGERTNFNLRTTTLSGVFVPVTGSITVYKLKDQDRILRKRKWENPDKFILTKEQHQASFPNDPYKDEDNYYKWACEKKIVEEKFDTEKDKTFNLNSIKQWPQGRYVLEISAKDKFGEEVKEVVYFSLLDSESKDAGLRELEYFAVNKSSGEPGEKASFLAGTAENLRILYEIEKDGKIIHKEWMNLKEEQRLVEIPLKDEYRGNVGVHYTLVKFNRLFSYFQNITVPFTNKALDISFETFRNKLLPGEKETWKIRVKGKKGEKVAAEMVATLYDASLNTFRPNSFNFDLYHSYYSTMQWGSVSAFDLTHFELYEENWLEEVRDATRSYDRLNWFGYYLGSRMFNERPSAISSARYSPKKRKSTESAESDDKVAFLEVAPTLMMDVADSVAAKREDVPRREERKKEKEDLSGIKARTNFDETAFFYPNLQTDSNGDILISFTIPEALTKWKMLGFAHTQDLKHGLVENELITQKELMVVPNVPRFFREGDQLEYALKITNLADKDLTGDAKLMLFDAITMKPVDHLLQNKNSVKSFTAKRGQSTSVTWNISIPEGIQAVTYKVVAKAGNFSDGEEMAVPVLTNRMLVTETLPLSVKSKQTRTFTLDKMVNNTSSTLKNHNLTLEFTSQPAWYAIQALPYLMEFPYECAEQTFSKFYANSIASHIANSDPKIKRVFDQWKESKTTDGTLASNLEKNEELKSILVQETPWVRDAQNESERKKRVAILFDLNRMTSEVDNALNKLIKMQYSNGGWPWFEGMRENRYITQHIVAGLGHLDHLKVKEVRANQKVWEMTVKAVHYLDQELIKDYQELKRQQKKNVLKISENHLAGTNIQYLYARSYFKDIPASKDLKEAQDYYMSQAKKYWVENGTYYQGMITLALNRYGDLTTPKDIIKSLLERAQVSEEMGMYWKENWGYYWWQSPVETQALMIEVFDEVAKNETAVDNLKVWLLKQKQTQNWRTTKATTEACYALLLRGTNWLASEELVEISLGDMKVDPRKIEGARPEAGTDYFKTSWGAGEIKKDMGKVTVKKRDEGVSWGALYWQYFEQLDKITPAETPLKLKKQVFVEKNTDKGPVITPIDNNTVLKVGDLLKVRIELRVDRNMEYVHMKDMRASGFEPLNVLSGYKFQDGLGYYESTRDAATNFFFDYLPKGTYVFEYPLRVTHKGNFSNGITSIQSMYAPEFASHSEGIRVKVE